MRLIKIDPQTRTIEFVDLDGKLDSFRQAIGCNFIDVCARQGNLDALTVDDDALELDSQPPAFRFNSFGPVHGIAILSGVDEEGDTQEPTMTREEVEKAVTWLGDIHTKPGLVWMGFMDVSDKNLTIV